jgi:hypothetical protein
VWTQNVYLCADRRALGLGLLSAGAQGAKGGCPLVQPRAGDGPDAGHGVRVPAPAHAATPHARGRPAAARGRAAAPAGVLRRPGPRVERGRGPARLRRPAPGGRAGASPPMPQAAVRRPGRGGRCLIAAACPHLCTSRLQVPCLYGPKCWGCCQSFHMESWCKHTRVSDFDLAHSVSRRCMRCAWPCRFSVQCPSFCLSSLFVPSCVSTTARPSRALYVTASARCQSKASACCHLRSACSRRRAWAAQRQRPPRAQALLESEGLRLRTENTAFVAASAWLARRGDDAAAAAALAPLLRFPCMSSAFLIDAVPQARPRSGARGGARRPAAAPRAPEARPPWRAVAVREPAATCAPPGPARPGCARRTMLPVPTEPCP